MTLKQAFPEVAAPSKPDTRVTVAAEWLDENYPGWYKRVTKRIIMSNSMSCVAGQVTHNGRAFARFSDSIKDAEPFGGDQKMVPAWTTEIEFRLARDIVNS